MVAGHLKPGSLPTELPHPFRGQPVAQVALLVPDLKGAIDTWSAMLGLPVDEWLVYTYGPDNVADLTYRGEQGRFRMQLALGGHAPQVELIQAIDGPSIYEEWLDRHGHGLHHLGFVVRSVERAVAQATAAGLELIQYGRGYGLDGDGGFAYFDSTAMTGLICEAIEVPTRRRPTEVLA